VRNLCDKKLFVSLSIGMESEIWKPCSVETVSCRDLCVCRSVMSVYLVAGSTECDMERIFYSISLLCPMRSLKVVTGVEYSFLYISLTLPVVVNIY